MVDEHSPLHIEAKTLELALLKAGAALGVPHDQLAYRVLKDRSGSIASFFTKRNVELEVWSKEGSTAYGGGLPSSDRRPPAMSAPPSFREEDEPVPLSEAERDALIDELRDYCQELCAITVGEDVPVTAKIDNNRLILDIDNDFLLSSVARYPKTVEALEHLIRKKPRHLRRGLPFMVFVDIKQHRIGRENELIGLAKDLAEKVCENKKPIVMNCKGSHERRVIHLALDGDHRVYTKSIGSGFDRKLMILPAKRSPT